MLVGRERTQSRTNVIRVVGISLALATLAWTFRGTEPARIGALLGRVGAAGALILLPQLLSLLVESIGWRLAFDAMGRRLPLTGLFRARLATEALAQTLPLGVVFCESMKPVLLARNCGADLATSLSGMAARKWLLVSAQGVYVAGFGLLAFPVQATISRPLLGAPGLPYLVLGGAGLLFVLAAVSYGLLAHGRLASRIHALLGRLPWAWLRSKLALERERFSPTDVQIQRFFERAWSSPLPWLAFLAGWLFEAADTLIILYVLGVRLPWTTVGALEVPASSLRNVAFMVPAGLGVQDVGYLAFLRALAVPDALNVAAAFLLLKRGKECVWAAVGYAVLALDLRVAVRRTRILPC